MKLAILSDIHANLEALEAVLSDAARQGVTHYACLGDTIGFNGDPAACLELLLPRLSVAVRGNHEQALLQRGLFGVPLYTAMMDRTAAMLDAQALTAIRAMPLTAEWRGITFAHASPMTPAEWPRLSSLPDARQAFGSFTGFICFCGHTHRATVFREQAGRISAIPVACHAKGDFSLQLEQDCRYLINPGSVGQPRDLDPRASYALYDDEEQLLTLRRVPYDIAAAAGKISRTGLPASFAEALKRGASPL